MDKETIKVISDLIDDIEKEVTVLEFDSIVGMYNQLDELYLNGTIKDNKKYQMVIEVIDETK